MENGLIAAGVSNLKEFGYKDVDSQNILTDSIYSAFFKSMLEDNKGYSAKVDAAIERLLQRIDAASKEQPWPLTQC